MSLFAEPPAEILIGKAMKTPEGVTHRVTRGDQILGFVQVYEDGWRAMAWGVMSGHFETQEQAVSWLTEQRPPE